MVRQFPASWSLVLAFLICQVAGQAAMAGSASEASDVPRVRTSVGLWLTVWWTKDDQFNHWRRCHRLPARGTYEAGDPAVIADHYAQFRDLGIDFLIMDDTNGCGVDAGRINDNIRAWFDFMDAQPAEQRIPICIGSGGEMRAAGAQAQRRATDYYWQHWAQRPSYFHFDGKPLVLIDTDKNYGPGDFNDERFTVRWAYNGDNHEAMGRAKTWGWGSYEPCPILDESMSIMPGQRYGYEVAQYGHSPRETPREGGQLYVRMWLRVLKANPQTVTIADWNNFIEETAIEDCHNWEDAKGYAVSDLYTRITRAYSRLRKGQLTKGEYYRDESRPEVYLFDGTKLIYQGGMPNRAAVIQVPEGWLDRISERAR